VRWLTVLMTAIYNTIRCEARPVRADGNWSFGCLLDLRQTVDDQRYRASLTADQAGTQLQCCVLSDASTAAQKATRLSSHILQRDVRRQHTYATGWPGCGIDTADLSSFWHWGRHHTEITTTLDFDGYHYNS